MISNHIKSTLKSISDHNKHISIATAEEPIRILLIGNGGREHALAWKLNQSARVEAIFVIPGNGGTAHELSKVSNISAEVQPNDYPGLVAFAKRHNVNLVIPGPEAPLVDGIEGFFREGEAASTSLTGIYDIVC